MLKQQSLRQLIRDLTALCNAVIRAAATLCASRNYTHTRLRTARWHQPVAAGAARATPYFKQCFLTSARSWSVDTGFCM